MFVTIVITNGIGREVPTQFPVGRIVQPDVPMFSRTSGRVHRMASRWWRPIQGAHYFLVSWLAVLYSHVLLYGNPYSRTVLYIEVAYRVTEARVLIPTSSYLSPVAA